MKPNNFIYADISTYSPEKTIAFYEAVFGWKYYKSDATLQLKNNCPDEIPRIESSDLSVQEFVEQFEKTTQPVIIRGTLKVKLRLY